MPEAPVPKVIDYATNPDLRLVMWAYMLRIADRALADPLRHGVGALLQPRPAVNKFVHEDLHRDPPEFREFVIAEFWRWMALRHQHERTEGFERVNLRFLEGEEASSPF